MFKSLFLYGPVFLAATSFLSGQTGPTVTVALPHNTPNQVADHSAVLVQHLSPDQMLRITIGLKPPHPDEEQQFLKDVQDKHSPLFHQFLSPDDWNARFGPSAADEQAVVDWAISHGLTVTERYSHRLTVSLEASSGVVEKAFEVTMNTYQSDSGTFFSNDRDPAIPTSLSQIVQGVSGLNSLEVFRPAMRGFAETASSVTYSSGPA